MPLAEVCRVLSHGAAGGWLWRVVEAKISGGVSGDVSDAQHLLNYPIYITQVWFPARGNSYELNPAFKKIQPPSWLTMGLPEWLVEHLRPSRSPKPIREDEDKSGRIGEIMAREGSTEFVAGEFNANKVDEEAIQRSMMMRFDGTTLSSRNLVMMTGWMP
ncbi:hypothetical protein C8J56DRAFT_895365 [Mycena floridula]|nr:hypothetical protein C8J56DRAFT_895365 [Mycena floridula]